MSYIHPHRSYADVLIYRGLQHAGPPKPGTREGAEYQRLLSLYLRRESWKREIEFAFTRGIDTRYTLSREGAAWLGGVHLNRLGSGFVGPYENAFHLLLDAATIAGDQDLLSDLTEGGVA